MTEFHPQIPKPIAKNKRISKTYRFSPATIALVQKAIQNFPFKTATSFIEEAVTQFASYILRKPK